MLLIPFIVCFIIGWRVGARAKRFTINHALGIAIFGTGYSFYAVNAYADRAREAGYDASHIYSTANYVYSFGYAVIGCGGLMLLAGWLSSRRRIKKAMRETQTINPAP